VVPQKKKKRRRRRKLGCLLQLLFSWWIPIPSVSSRSYFFFMDDLRFLSGFLFSSFHELSAVLILHLPPVVPIKYTSSNRHCPA
jgi:hypothetical protein